MKKLRITVGEKVYEVSVEILDDGGTPPPVAAAPTPTMASSVSAPIAKPSATSVSAGESGPGTVTSPLSGKVFSVDVKIGQAVSEGDQLLTIEAMKMNTYVFAPSDGKIAEIHVTAGDGVEEGQMLLRIE